ncbi:dystroglycan-like [Dorcoceras hygrometricum]|uniref:Dystroglycan-like n=1 Tax=Dorcoceras hygrometricum TaxID=472368 RepID=A0A2Z7BBU2_9LAMI|nr:dystroglycan-like [Dorcoceras hygrometricum]
MASSFYSNAQHVDFESVLSMDDHGMVSMFEALMASGLRGFLGCPAVVYEDALVDFFENASVRSGVIISTVGGQLVEISEERFAESFELPLDGFGDLSEIPKDAIFDARSIVSLSGEPISLSGSKNQMKMPFRLLCDIMAKAISVKAGSFNAITVEKFSLITAVVCRIKMNWAKFLFSILKKMISPGSKQAKGFAIQISLLLATFPSLELGESSESQPPRLMKKRWADVSLEVTDFCASRRLLPVGSINFCRALEIVETDSCFASRQSTVFSLRLSQFCTIHIQYSLFSSLSTPDISDFLSSIALDRTAFRSVQIDQSVVPSVQLSLDQRPSSPISPDSSSSLRFDQTDIDATASSRPPISQDLSAAFADFKPIFWSKFLNTKVAFIQSYIKSSRAYGAEEVTGAAKKKAVSKKRPAADVGAAVPKKKRTFKKKSISSISSLELVEVAEEAIPIQQVAEPSADDVDVIIQQVIDETRAADAPADTTQPAVTEEKHWFDLPYEDLVKQWEAERPVVTASDTDEDLATVDVAPAVGVQQVEESVAPISASDDTLSADEQMSLDDILLTIPVDIPLPSSCMEITKISMGKSIKIPGVSKWTWFLKSLPRISAEDKGKEVLVEKDPVKGNPAEEHYSLICADIELLVSLRAQVIDEVAKFFHSFSLRKLASINLEDMYKKEEQVLHSGETESPQVAIQRKFYILLKYRTVLVWKFLDAWRANFVPGQGSSAVDIQVIELLSDLYISFLEELAKEARAHNLIWNKPCCSKIFEGSPRDRGAVIARTNSNNRSMCWIRKMILVDGLWTVELCADKWVKIPRKVISTEIPRQRQFDDTLPSMSVFFRLMKKRWADVSLEVTDFCASRRLLPVGSINFCRALEIVETDSCFASHQSTVFSLRLSQFCTIQIQYSLFRSLSTADISEFLSSIALDRTTFRSVQIAQSVVPSVQLSLDQRPSSPISPDSSSSLRFEQTDIDATASSRPPISQDLSAAFADLQANLLEKIFEYQSGLSSKLHKIEQSVCDSLRDQADIFRNLSQGARQEVRTLDDVQSIRFNEFRKTVLAQNASIFQGLADVRHEVEDVNAKLVDYIHRGSADKKGESGSRGLQQPANVQIEGSSVTPTFEQRVEMAQRRIVHTVLDADRDAAERDRERRRREARALKRRRRD